MTSKPEQQRRLAAIMFTDVVGYSALTHRDEERSLELLNEHRRLVEPLFADYDGQVIKTTGDGFHVEFPSAVQAVRCAVDVQTRMGERNRTNSADDELQIRIGVHLGDVIFQDGDVFGDGVNVAARIEPFAEPGGVCVSSTVYEHVRNKLDASFEELGTRALKNIDDPVAIYRVAVPDPATATPVTSPESEPPRVAVLPLVNISPDPEDEYFTDGMTEEFIYTLSKIRGLRVIAQTSVMQYKGTEKNVATIGRELNVGTVLEGSVRKSGNRLRITAQLIEAKSEEHLWAGRYDRDLEDVFAIQSEIAEQVAEELEVALIGEDKTSVDEELTEDLEAYQFYLKGWFYWNKLTEEAMWESVNCFQKAVALDPKFASAHAGLATAYHLIGSIGLMPPNDASVKTKDAAYKALELNPNLSTAYRALGFAEYVFDWNWHDAEEKFQRAIALNPNEAGAYHVYALLLTSLGKVDEAIVKMERALQLDPCNLLTICNMAMILTNADRYSEAVDRVQQALQMDPHLPVAHARLGLIRAGRGEHEKAVASLERAHQLEPKHPLILSALGRAYALAGQGRRARGTLEELHRLSEEKYVAAENFARVHAGLGETDQALDWLEKAYEQGSDGMADLKVGPAWDTLRSDPRFQELLRQVGLEA